MPLQVALDYPLATGALHLLRHDVHALQVLPQVMRTLEADAARVAEEFRTAAARELLRGPLDVRRLLWPFRFREELIATELPAETEELCNLLVRPELPEVRRQGLLDGGLNLLIAFEAGNQLQVIEAQLVAARLGVDVAPEARGHALPGVAVREAELHEARVDDFEDVNNCVQKLGYLNTCC